MRGDAATALPAATASLPTTTAGALVAAAIATATAGIVVGLITLTGPAS